MIREELMQLREKFGEERRTQFAFDDALDDEDLIPDDDIVISSTRLGYIKRMSPENFRQQNRGGKGIRGMQTLDNDNIEDEHEPSLYHALYQ